MYNEPSTRTIPSASTRSTRRKEKPKTFIVSFQTPRTNPTARSKPKPKWRQEKQKPKTRDVSFQTPGSRPKPKPKGWKEKKALSECVKRM